MNPTPEAANAQARPQLETSGASDGTFDKFGFPRERRDAILTRCEFTLHPLAVATLNERLRSAHGDRISAAMIAGIEKTSLASYYLERKACTPIIAEIQVGDFAAQFNRQPHRQLPEDVGALRALIENCFIAQEEQRVSAKMEPRR